MLFAAAAGTTIAALYAVGFHASARASHRDFLTWVLDLASPDTGLGYRMSYWHVSWDSPVRWLRGLAGALVAMPPSDLVRSPLLAAGRAVRLAGIAASALAYAGACRAIFREDCRTHALLLAHAVPLAAFSATWEPANFEIKIALLPFLWLGVACGCAFWIRRREGLLRAGPRGGLAFLVALLAAQNFFAAVRPAADPSRNRDLARARFVREHTEPDAVIYLAGAPGGYSAGKACLPYFAGRRTRVLDWVLGRGAASAGEALAPWLRADSVRPPCVLSELLEPGPALETLARHHDFEAGAIRAALLELRPVEVARMDDGFAIYRLQRAPATGRPLSARERSSARDRPPEQPSRR